MAQAAVVAVPAVVVVPAVAVSAMFAAVGQRAAEDPITPVSAPPTKKGGWQPVSTFQGLIGISGGFCRKPLGAQSIEWTSGNKTHRFVELAKNAEWFLKGVGGAKTQKGDLKAVTVLDEIRDKLNSTAEPSAVAGPSAVADGDDDDAPDPMDALDEVPDTPLKATKKAARTPQKKEGRVSHRPIPGSDAELRYSGLDHRAFGKIAGRRDWTAGPELANLRVANEKASC